MRADTIKEYNKELHEYFNALEEANSDALENLGVKGDFEGFVLELAMMGLVKLKREAQK